MKPAQPVTSARTPPHRSVTTVAFAPQWPLIRIIARLNVGGPAIQAISLTQRLQQHGYETTLLRGQLARGEGSMDHLAEAAGVHPVTVPGLRRDLGWHDLRALWELVRWMRR